MDVVFDAEQKSGMSLRLLHCKIFMFFYYLPCLLLLRNFLPEYMGISYTCCSIHHRLSHISAGKNYGKETSKVLLELFIFKKKRYLTIFLTFVLILSLLTQHNRVSSVNLF